jgi:hypothetical protein
VFVFSFTMKRDTIKVGTGHIDDIGATSENLLLHGFFNDTVVEFENNHLLLDERGKQSVKDKKK